MPGRLRQFFLGCVSTAGFYLIAAVLGAVVPSSASDTGLQTVRIGLVSGPIHTDFLLPLDASTQDAFVDLQMADLPVAHPQAEWLLIGWGAKDFYTTVGSYADVSFGATSKAIFSDSAVIRAQVFGPIGTDAPIRWITMSDAQYQALIDEISNSFALPIDVLPVDAGDNAAFIAALGRFNIFNTCNQWISQTLRGAGIRFGLWTPTPFAVALSHRLYHRE